MSALVAETLDLLARARRVVSYLAPTVAEPYSLRTLERARLRVQRLESKLAELGVAVPQ